MEDEIAALTEQVATLSADLAAVAGGATNTVFAETYYYLTIPLMVLIHVGFLA